MSRLVVKMVRGDWYECQREGKPEKYQSLEIWKNDNADWYRIKSVSIFSEICDSKKTLEEAIDWMHIVAERTLDYDPIFYPKTVMPQFHLEYGPAWGED